MRMASQAIPAASADCGTPGACRVIFLPRKRHLRTVVVRSPRYGRGGAVVVGELAFSKKNIIHNVRKECCGFAQQETGGTSSVPSKRQNHLNTIRT